MSNPDHAPFFFSARNNPNIASDAGTSEGAKKAAATRKARGGGARGGESGMTKQEKAESAAHHLKAGTRPPTRAAVSWHKTHDPVTGRRYER